MKLTKLFIVAAAAFLFMNACTQQVANNARSNAASPQPSATAPPATPADEVAAGRKIFEQNCAVCHTDQGTGGEKVIEGKKLDVEDLTSDKIKGFTDEKITGYITNGIEDEGMPAFKDDLSADEIKEVVKFIRKEFHKK